MGTDYIHDLKTEMLFKLLQKKLRCADSGMTGYDHMEGDFPVLFAFNCRADMDHDIQKLCFCQLPVIILAQNLNILQDRFTDLRMLFKNLTDLRIFRKMSSVCFKHRLQMVG